MNCCQIIVVYTTCRMSVNPRFLMSGVACRSVTCLSACANAALRGTLRNRIQSVNQNNIIIIANYLYRTWEKCQFVSEKWCE